MTVALVITIVAALLGCLISTLHYALRDFSLRQLELIAQSNGGMERLEPILKDTDGHALAVGALRVLCNIVTVVAILPLFGTFEVVSGGAVDHVVGLVPARMAVAVLVASLLIYLFTVVIPMSIAEHAGERLIHALQIPIRAVYWLAWPLRKMGIVDIAIKRLAGVHHLTEKDVMEDEILSVVTEGERGGNLAESEREMIEAVVEFRSQTVEEIMTPRTEIDGFELTNDLNFIKKFIRDAGHSRIPVYEGDLDHIAGILYVKDLLKYVNADTSNFELRPNLREALFVPESKGVADLLVELRTKKVHVAIVLDEYGGTTGLVTFEDILEEIVGEIQDEYEDPTDLPPEIVVDHSARSAEIDARAHIDDANDELKSIGIELPESDDYETVGGYVLCALGHIPVEGEQVLNNGYAMTVIAAEPTRITRLRVDAREPEAREPAEASPPPPEPPPRDPADQPSP